MNGDVDLSRLRNHEVTLRHRRWLCALRQSAATFSSVAQVTFTARPGPARNGPRVELTGACLRDGRQLTWPHDRSVGVHGHDSLSTLGELSLELSAASHNDRRASAVRASGPHTIDVTSASDLQPQLATLTAELDRVDLMLLCAELEAAREQQLAAAVTCLHARTDELRVSADPRGGAWTAALADHIRAGAHHWALSVGSWLTVTAAGATISAPERR